MSNRKDELTHHEALDLLVTQEEGENDERALACLYR